MNKYLSNLISDTRLALQWIQDIESGEMIESRGYTREHFIPKYASELNDIFHITQIVNHTLMTFGGYNYITKMVDDDSADEGKIIPIKR